MLLLKTCYQALSLTSCVVASLHFIIVDRHVESSEATEEVHLDYLCLASLSETKWEGCACMNSHYCC